VPSTYNHVWYTGNTKVARINDLGWLGVGVSPSYSIDTNGSMHTSARLYADTGATVGILNSSSFINRKY
jgi:hypothetical protein